MKTRMIVIQRYNSKAGYSLTIVIWHILQNINYKVIYKFEICIVQVLLYPTSFVPYQGNNNRSDY